ncbi:hypothetical protein CWI39_0312p0040 [Hamiltosporidium magnivora]|uniref:Uncharacterized protein n=1 Tax=Hamiltosporidium magnivora TaxID=148818 RepID=A0A4Q9LHM5_9MICR|nr:hypothetical protein CWI39_0312p0040 [Hamiltosporidium magnivora]
MKYVNITISILLRKVIDYVHYICGIMKRLTSYIFQDKNIKIEKKSNIRKNIDRFTMNRISFFIRKLLSELLIGFNFDSEKVKIYRIINILSYCSVNTKRVGEYLNGLFFPIMMRFFYRFIFDPECKFDKLRILDLISGIVCLLKNKDISNEFRDIISNLFFKNLVSSSSLKNRLNLLIKSNFNLVKRNAYIYYKNVKKQMNEKLKELNKLKETGISKIEEIKYYIDIELTLVYFERKLLPNFMNFLEFYQKNSRVHLLKEITKQIDKYFKVK